MKPRSPIIIIGMHRSGTSLVSRILEKLGLFVGKKKDKNNEAIFFQKLNIWILRTSGGKWDYPLAIKYLFKNKELLSFVEDYLEFMISSPRVISYLGSKNYFKYKNLFRLGIPWGWKDPRNTFTLPFWLKIFPKAKVVFVYRHGVDVANSLLIRQQKLLKKNLEKYLKLKKLNFYWFKPKKGGFTDTVRCSTIEGGFSLWEEYMEEALTQINMLEDRAMGVKFENLIEKPMQTLKPLIEFCELKPPKETFAEVIKKINPDRVYAYLNDQKLVAFAKNVSDRLKIYGYDVDRKS